MIPFDFNLYSALLLAPFVHGSIMAFVFLARYLGKRRWPDLFLSLLIFMLVIRLCFWMLGFAGWYDSHDVFTAFMFYFPFNTIIFLGPLLYFYFLSVTNNRFRPSKAHWVHLVLPALMLLLCLVKWIVDFSLYAPFPLIEAFQYGTRGPWAELDKHPMVYLISYASLLYYCIKTLSAYKRYTRYIKQHFSFQESISFYWLYQMLLVFGAGIICFLAFFIYNLVNPEASYIDNWYLYLVVGVLVYFISLNGYHRSSGKLFNQLQFVAEPEADSAVPEEPPTAGMEGENLALSRFMEEQKPFLDPELSLSSLARQAGMNSTQLSRLINEGFGQNFNEFINSYRVRAVLDELQKGKHQAQTIMGIAYDCGFNSKPTFNRAFKKLTGKTPKEWIQARKVEDDTKTPLSDTI
ncbi:MAG TPA: AraC family transcriptional regulator [Flavisolibacter sp.]|nr:AraC family transcriptional regulator [Flavisolibacter sp.]